MKGIFKYTYSCFIISVLLYGSTPVLGSLTGRQLFTIIMLIQCLLKEKRIYWDKYLSLYICFYFFFGLSCSIVGTMEYFFHNLLGYFVVSYVLYYATRICLISYGHKLLTLTLIGVGLLDSVVTILQYYNYSIVANAICTFLKFNMDDRVRIQMESANDILSGVSIPGIFLSPVENGLFLMICTIISITLIVNRLNSIRRIILFLVVYIIFVFTSFVCQQRAPFAAGVFFSVCLLYKITKGRYRIIMIAVSSCLAYFILSNMDLGRFEDFGDMGTRADIHNYSQNYINEHFFLGGIEDYRNRHVFSPHNLIYNAIIYSGIFGAVFVFLLLFKQICLIGRNIWFNPTSLAAVFGFIYLGCTFESWTHNVSIVTGTAIYWIIWSAFLTCVQYKQLEFK